MSASWSSDLQNSKQISLLFTNSIIKRYLVSMCLVFLWNTWFFDKEMVELLSHKMVVGSFSFYNMSFNILLIQTAWHATPVADTYFDSTEYRVTMGCFFKAHGTTPIPKWNVHLDVFFLSFVLPPLSLSVYPMSLKFYEVEYIMPRYFVPLTYLKILLLAFQWESFGDSINLEIILTSYISKIHMASNQPFKHRRI